MGEKLTKRDIEKIEEEMRSRLSKKHVRRVI